jgi:hypothetical protein
MKLFLILNTSVMNSYKTIVNDWRTEFIVRVKETVKSRKQDFTYLDALNKSKLFRNDFDNCLIEYSRFINSNPLCNNDYFKYVNSYSKGKELDLKYFKYDVNKLQDYYKKFDANKDKYSPFNLDNYNKYVLFMMLKLKGLYKRNQSVNKCSKCNSWRTSFSSQRIRHKKGV